MDHAVALPRMAAATEAEAALHRVTTITSMLNYRLAWSVWRYLRLQTRLSSVEAFEIHPKKDRKLLCCHCQAGCFSIRSSVTERPILNFHVGDALAWPHSRQRTENGSYVLHGTATQALVWQLAAASSAQLRRWLQRVVCRYGTAGSSG